MYDILVTPIDKHNDSTIILIKKYKFKKIIILVTEKCNDCIRECIINVAKENGSKLEFFKCGEDDFSIINKLIENNEVLLNLTGGERIQALYLLKFALEKKVDSIYIDILGRKKYIFGKNDGKVDEHLIDLNIEEMIHATGHRIISDETNLIKKNYVLEIAKKIHENIDLWDKYKRKIYDPSIFSHYYGDTKRVVVQEEVLNEEEKNLLYKILDYGVEKEIIKKFKEGNELVIEFKDKDIKGFIFKVGTWLEVLTEAVVMSIKSIDEVKSGLVFTWIKDNIELKNELDVVAIRDSSIIVISCKDSEKYEESALNELNVYSERIGGNKVKKILVATKAPHKKNIVERAKEMDIDIVVLEKDINKFREKIKKIIDR
ncbi:MAG: Card1-like endonuclease domain-containing protein [Clostridium sp.]|uniref:Card1-like endonuclease domain-containing protein n=1 Tax=Clostridium sp. TaxID=1506 RepID=UPI003F3B1586